MHKKSRGFTLIELLLVMGIVSLISTTVLASVSTARKKARDARRIADMSTIVAALEVMYQVEGHYFCSGPSDSTQANFLKYLVDQNYLRSIPRDPLNDRNSGVIPYWYTSYAATPGGTCGAYYQMNYDQEKGGNVVGSKCGVGGSIGQWVTSTHCHFDMPVAVPCDDPYNYINPVSANCGTIVDYGY